MPGINQLGGAQAVHYNAPQPSANEAANTSRVRTQSAVQPSSADAVKAAERSKQMSNQVNQDTAKTVDRQSRRFKKLRAQMQQIETDRVNLARGKPTGSVDNTETEKLLAENRMHNARSAAKNRAKTKGQQQRIASATRSAVQETNKEVSQLQRAMKDLFSPRPAARK